MLRTNGIQPSYFNGPFKGQIHISKRTAIQCITIKHRTLKKCDLRQVGGFLKNLDENLDVILSNNDVTHDCIDDIVSVEEEGGGWRERE
jgi:hypothetical protein